MPWLCNRTRICASSMSRSEELSARGAQNVMKAIRQSQVTKLALSREDPLFLHEASEWMQDYVNELHKLQHLDLSNLYLENDRFHHPVPRTGLPNLQQLTRLTLRCGLYNDGWRILAKGVSTITTLRHLEFVGGTLSAYSMSTLCHSGLLHACATLQVLEFRHCRLNNAAVKALAESWPTTTLRTWI